MGDIENFSSGSASNKDEKTASVFVVDPTPPNGEVYPPEDLFIYVKFSARPRNRTTYAGQDSGGAFNTGVEDEVDFISTEIKYNSAGKVVQDGEPGSGQETYSTTNWTDIGGFYKLDKDGNTKSSGVLEGFGIKSIDIKYNASLVPVVDITFTDVRGSALFDVIKDKDRLSPYSIFFKLPYPIFTLSIKGYYGQKVDYCLHMTNWTSNFDGTTGNFDISANFLGYQQAFLNDMVIGNIIGAVGTKDGFNRLNAIYDSQDGVTFKSDSRRLDDFFNKISKIQLQYEVLKGNDKSFKAIKDKNGQLKLLKQLNDFIGSPINKQIDSNGDGVISDSEKEINKTANYLETKNDPTETFGKPIDDTTLVNKINYLSIRDFLVINYVNEINFKNYIITLNGIIKLYQKYIVKSELSDPFDLDLIISFMSTGDENNYKNFIVTNKADGSIDADKLENVLTNMHTAKDQTYYLSSDWSRKGESAKGNDGENNISFDKSNFTKQIKNNDFYPKGGSMSKDTNVFVADFREQRAKVRNKIILLERELTKLKKTSEDDLNLSLEADFKDALGFLPKIKNCFTIISNNAQAMVETIYDITNKAESGSLLSGRIATLAGYETDIPLDMKSTTGIAWPSIYDRDTDGSFNEIYIGDASNININDFPEYAFVEEVFDVVVKKQKKLEQITKNSVISSLDTDNWFPINPIDYEVNPAIALSTIPSKPAIVDELLKQLFIRSAILTNYSLFNNSTGLPNISNYGDFDGIFFNESISDPKRNGVIKNLLDEIELNLSTTIIPSNSLIGGSDYYKNNISTTNDGFLILEGTGLELPKIGNIPISGKRNPSVDYILFDKDGIANNTSQLISQISSNTLYLEKIYKDNPSIIKNENWFTTKYNSTNLTTNVMNNVWLEPVATNIGKENESSIKSIDSTTIYNIDYPAETLPANTTENRSPNTTDPNSEINLSTTPSVSFLNRTNFDDSQSETNQLEVFMTESSLYRKQSTNNARAYLLLSTLPYKTFNDGVLSVTFPNKKYNGARVVIIPRFYILFIGSILWRWRQLNDPINFNVTIGNGSKNYSNYSTPKGEYLTKMGAMSGTKDSPIESELLTLPEHVQDKFIEKFEDWVSNNAFTESYSGSFEKVMTTYRGTTDPDNNVQNQAAKDILKLLKVPSSMVIAAPSIFNPISLNDGLVISMSDFKSYVKSFTNGFKNKSNATDEKFTDEEIEKKEKDVKILKLSIYNYFKNVNNKWVSDSEKPFDICGGRRNLKDYFKFIDSGWSDIGDKATLNLKSFLNLGNDWDTSVYVFISKLLRDSNFLLQILPNYVNFKDDKEVSKMFKPSPTIEGNSASGPIYCCMYIGGISQSLNIGEKSNYYYKDDGFRFKTGEIPSIISDTTGNVKDGDGVPYSLVAFRVAFGAENQSIFKNVALSQQEHKETAEYFSVMADMIDKRGGTQKTYQGTDLLKIFKARSYTCKVDGLGCMNIQPLMYFDLQNVPFFDGAYMITNVTHNISPNHMTTNFQGIRQSKFITKANEKYTTNLDVNFNESSEIPLIEYTNLSSNNATYGIGVRTIGGDVGENDSNAFDYVKNFTIGNFIDLGVPEDIGISSDTINQFKNILTTGDTRLTTNAEVVTFLTNVLSNSNFLQNTEKPWDTGSSNISDYVVKFDATSPPYSVDTPNPLSGKIKYYISPINGDILYDSSYSENYLSTQPRYSADTNSYKGDVAYNPITTTPKLSEYENYDGFIKEIQQLEKLNSNGTISTIAKLKNITRIKQFEDAISILKYYNIFQGDAYRYRPRGYLYMIGRRQYWDLNAKGSNVNFSKFYLKTPELASETPEEAFRTAFLVWTKLKDKNGKTPYDYTNNKTVSIDVAGSASTFLRTISSSQQLSEGNTTQNSFEVFEKVLTTFIGSDNQPLIDTNRP